MLVFITSYTNDCRAGFPGTVVFTFLAFNFGLKSHGLLEGVNAEYSHSLPLIPHMGLHSEEKWTTALCDVRFV